MSRQVRIATYNICDGGHGREVEIRAALRGLDADVLLLQEVSSAGAVNALAVDVGMQSAFVKANTKWNLAVLSRWPVVAVRGYRTLPLQQAILDATIQVEDGPAVRVLTLNLCPLPSVLCEVWRWSELRVLSRIVDARDSTPTLVAGDFNATAPGDDGYQGVEGHRLVKAALLAQANRVFTFAVRSFLALDWHDCFRELHPADLGFTVPAVSPKARVDYIFANPSARASLHSCVVSRDGRFLTASDHLPVVADFAF